MTSREQRIRAVMAVVFNLPEDRIPADATQGSFESWDSLGHMNLITALEDEFGVRFPDDALESMISIKLISLALQELGIK
jgi:acyl carrier protein